MKHKDTIQTVVALLAAFIAGAALVVAIFTYKQSERDNALDELLGVVQLTDKQRAEYAKHKR